MPIPFLGRAKSSEPPTLRAEARLSDELRGLDTPTRLARLGAAMDAGDIDQAAFTRVLRYLAWWDAQAAEDASLEQG